MSWRQILAMSDESYRCTECGMIHDELPDHCDLCYATNDKFFEVLKDG